MTFEEFAAARLPAVLRFAAVLTGDRSLAEDVVQEVLLRASRRWDAIAGLDRPEAYLRKMIVNEYLSWRRRSWRLVPSGTGTEVDGRLTPDPAAGHAEREALLGELARRFLFQALGVQIVSHVVAIGSVSAPDGVVPGSPNPLVLGGVLQLVGGEAHGGVLPSGGWHWAASGVEAGRRAEEPG